jgi:serine/threonine protein kinase
MSQMCPACSFDNPHNAKICEKCSASLRGLLAHQTELGNRYRVTGVLGCGAMGAVYLAEDGRLIGRRCAIKENRPNADDPPEMLDRMKEQFLAEASVLARLDHAGLPKVSDYFIEAEREYLVMDYVEGQDLNAMLQEAGTPLAESAVLNWADQTLDALAYLHNQHPQPIIHRDIKPANLRITPQGKIKLVDFGLVKLFDAGNPDTKVELRGLGTPAYAPLEQFAGSKDHTDTRSDLYALGATLYHLLTNLYPPDVHQRLLKPELLPPPRELNRHLSENTEQVILRAMEIHPSQRFQSAEEMRQALTNPLLPTPNKSTAGWLNPTVSPLTFGLVGFVLVLIILGGVAWLVFDDYFPASSGAVTPTTPTAAMLTASPSALPSPTSAAMVDANNNKAATNIPTRVVTAVTPTVSATPLPTTGPTATPQPTQTPTPAILRAIPSAWLNGTIAYPVFNGVNYNLYFGMADGSGNQFFRENTSQPAFSPDGKRIAFHSWRQDAWGLTAVDLSGANDIVVARFVEDQLPTWTTSGEEIVFLSRRAGDRKSRLYKVGSNQTNVDGIVLGEGEYPTIGLTGQMVFKGWGSTGTGLNLSTDSLSDIQPLTDHETDTAPAIAPNGQQIAFMSRRDGNWEIYIVNSNGSNLRRLTDNAAEDGLPTWSPDGRVLAFASNRDEGWAVWAILPNGLGLKQLFEMEGSPDGFVGDNSDASRGWAEERMSWTR